MPPCFCGSIVVAQDIWIAERCRIHVSLIWKIKGCKTSSECKVYGANNGLQMSSPAENGYCKFFCLV